jgi:hypothetical protein
MNTARIGAALAALALLFGGAWLIGHATRSTVARGSGVTSSLSSASIQRPGVAIPDLPATVALPSLAAAHRSAAVATAPAPAQTTASAQTPTASQAAPSQPSSSAPARTYIPPSSSGSSSGSSGASHATTTKPKTQPQPVVGGNN